MVYVDTSVLVALLTVEPKTQSVTAWYAGLQETPTTANWMLTEFSSAISIKVRTGQLSEADAKQVRKEFDLLINGGLRLVMVSREAFRQAGELVKQHKKGLRAGDSLHLAVALELGAKHMATLDTILGENARWKGLEIIEF